MPADKPKKMGRQNYDWNTIKHDYVTDPKMSLRKIAEKYGIRLCTIAQKSKEDGWYEVKQKHQTNVITKAITKTAEKQARALSEEADFLQMMKGHVGRLLADKEQFHRHLVQTSSFSPEEGSMVTTEERIFEKVDSRALKDTMQVLKMMEEMTRSLHELQKVETLQKHQIEKARLELERERFEFEKQKAEFARPDSTNVIKIDGIEEGWTE